MSPKGLIPATLIALLTAAAAGRPARALDPTCRTVLDALHKQGATPTHVYATETSSAAHGKPRNMEMIYVGDTHYLQVNGRWRRSPVTSQDMRKQEEENLRTAKVLACSYLRDEAVNGEAAAVYIMRSENEGVKSDGTVWISKRTGLPLKSDNNVDTGDEDKMHMVIRYEYTDVRPPAGVK